MMGSVGGKLSEIVNCEGFEESLFLDRRSGLFCFEQIGRCLRKPPGIQGTKSGVLLDSPCALFRMRGKIVVA